MTAWIARALLLVLAVFAVPTDEAAVNHVIDRMSFGVRPGDIDRVKTLGIEQYIDEQLHPERMADGGVDARLTDLPTLRMNSREIAEQFEVPQIKARQAAARGNTNAADAKPDPEMQRRANAVMLELAEQKILRAVYSKRQLQEVLVDFWFNHFNVDARKGADRFMLTEYERDVIRPHVFGRFRDLLEATAKSPAMLFYLDNWMSVDPNGPHVEVPPARLVRGPFGAPILVQPPPRMPNQNANAPKGLNENYGRELMELHTLGVDGGYTQKDVTEVARAFTGWTIDRPRQGGGFTFDPRRHDNGQKIVLGTRHQSRRRTAGRRRGPRHPRAASVDGALHRDEARASIRQRHAAAGPRRSRRRALPRDRRQSARGDADAADLAGVLRGRRVSRESQDAASSLSSAPCARRTPTSTTRACSCGRSPISASRSTMSAADRLQRHSRRMGEHWRARRPHEFRIGAGRQQMRGVIVSNAHPDGVELGTPEFQRR